MNSSLKKLLFFRYKTAIFLIALLIFGIYFFQTFNGIASWKSNYHFFSTEKAQKDFKNQINNSFQYNDEDAGQVFLYYDLKNEKTIYTDDFEEYKQYSLIMFTSNKDANQLAFNSYSYYNENFLIFLVIFVSAGVLLFLFDLRSQFTAALFSSRFKRSEIYWTKYYFIGGTLAGSLLISKLAAMFAYRIFIPEEYLNISFQQHFLSTFSGWLTLMSLFLISSLIGLLFGEWLFGIGAVVILFFTFSNFLTNIDTINQSLFIKDAEMTATVSTTTLNRVLPVVQASIQKNNLGPLCILIVLGLAALFWGKRIFNAISLDTTGNFILVPKYNRLFQIIIIIYFMIVFSSGTILVTVYAVDPLPVSTLILNCLKVLATFIGLFLATEYVLFNNKSKIINKINIFN